MFTLPPRPPKDYFIKDVNKCLQSNSQFSPESQPRVTQPNLAQYCYPIEYTDDEIPEKTPPEPVKQFIMNKWANDARAWWVTAPGKEDFFVHDVYKKYSYKRDIKSFDPRYMHKEKVFNRSYKYELDCIEAARLEKLREKSEREDAEFEHAFNKLMHKQQEMEKPKIQVKSCKEEPPFWWRPGGEEAVAKRLEPFPDLVAASPTTYRAAYVRWQEEPNLTAFVQDDPCKRKYDMHRVGQPFKNEACNFYYKNYPPPSIKFRPKRFL